MAAYWFRTMVGRRSGGSGTKDRRQAAGCRMQVAGGRMQVAGGRRQVAFQKGLWWFLLSAACSLAPAACRLLAQAPPPLKKFSHAKHQKLGNVAPVIAGAIDKGTYLGLDGATIRP